jgi:hypothetical protein
MTRKISTDGSESIRVLGVLHTLTDVTIELHQVDVDILKEEERSPPDTKLQRERTSIRISEYLRHLML